MMHTGDTKMNFLLDKIEYSVAQFHEEFGHRLPVMAEVTQGFFGEITQDTFDKEQVIRIHTKSRQKRVVMETRHAGTKQSFSIPVTYHAKFCIVNKHGKAGKELTLVKITSKEKFPVTVQFAKKEDITVGNRHTSTSHFPKMQLVNIFDEMYLLGNVVNYGEFTEPVVSIPLYLSQMRLSRIVGIRGQEVKFKYLLERFAHFAEQVTYDREFGNKEIAVYGPDTIPKDTVYQYVQPQTYTGLATFLKQHGHAGQSGRYEPFQHNSDSYEPLRHTDAAGQATNNVYEEIKPHQAAGQLTRETKPPKYTPTETQRTEKVDLSGGLPDRTPPIAPRKPMKPSATRQNAARPSVKPPSIPLRTTLPRADMPLPDRPTTEAANVTYANAIPRGNIRPTAKFGNTPKEVKRVPYVTPVPVKPDVRPAPDKVHISGLRIEEVCEWMKYLKLDKYCEKFREQMIDGDLLLDLDKDILSGEFGLSPIESLRLMKFVKKGHIPM